MIHIENQSVREHILDGDFGLERESLRVLGDGSFSHTAHPFPEDEHIVRDFCENQVEINTGVHKSVQGAMEELKRHHRRLVEKLDALPEREFLWPFSNPPYIKDEKDIPVAEFEGVLRNKTIYRDYLSGKYGRYKMTFSGIHFNFSFSDEMLRKDFELSGGEDFSAYRDSLYLNLAKGLAEYGWILVAVTAASPVFDLSFVEKGKMGETVFSGLASIRCSELGYWNDFVPVFDYTDLYSYVESIQKCVEEGWLNAPSELYYPIRLKSEGENNLDVLLQKGVNHIELRMIDLNPLTECYLDARDIEFAHLLMVWICAGTPKEMNGKEQIRAAQNFKRAAHYDLRTVNYVARDGFAVTMQEAGKLLIEQMKRFFADYPASVTEVLDYEYDKFIDGSKRYAWQVRTEYGEDFVEKGMEMIQGR